MINPIATHPASNVSLEYATLAAAQPPISAKATTSQLETPVSVRISLEAEIRLLEKQGISVNNIALQLGLDTPTVTRYLA